MTMQINNPKPDYQRLMLDAPVPTAVLAFDTGGCVIVPSDTQTDFQEILDELHAQLESVTGFLNARNEYHQREYHRQAWNRPRDSRGRFVRTRMRLIPNEPGGLDKPPEL